MPLTKRKDIQIEIYKKIGFERISKEKIFLTSASKLYLIDGISAILTTEIYKRKKLSFSTLLKTASKYSSNTIKTEKNVHKLVLKLATIKAIRLK